MEVGVAGWSARLGVLGCLLSSGCGLWHNGRRFLHPAEYTFDEPRPAGDVAEVTYESGWRADGPRAYEPVGSEHGTQPVDLSPQGWLTVRPMADDAELRVWVRGTGALQRGFSQVVTVTGTTPQQLALQVRAIAGPLQQRERTVSVADLSNVYNDFRFEDGDLLLVEVTSQELQQTERYWFRHRDVGLRTKGVAGVLVRFPVPWTDQAGGTVSPALSAGLALGYRPRSRSTELRWLFDQVAVVGSVAIGSTAFDEVVAATGAEDTLDGAFNAALVGGGIEVLDFLSLQLLVNASAPFRDANEGPATLAIGLDALQFAVFARDATTRLLFPNTLSAQSEEKP